MLVPMYLMTGEGGASRAPVSAPSPASELTIMRKRPACRAMASSVGERTVGGLP